MENVLILTPVWASLISAVVLIGYGIVVEKRFVAYFSAVMNVIFGAIILASTSVPFTLYFAVLPYLVLGIIALSMNARKLYFLFGTKTFGSFCLALWFYQITPSSALSYMVRILLGTDTGTYDTTVLIIGIWFVSAAFINGTALAFKYGTHTKPSGQRG